MVVALHCIVVLLCFVVMHIWLHVGRSMLLHCRTLLCFYVAVNMVVQCAILSCHAKYAEGRSILLHCSPMLCCYVAVHMVMQCAIVGSYKSKVCREYELFNACTILSCYTKYSVGRSTLLRCIAVLNYQQQ